MKIFPSNENNNQQPARGRHYNDPVQSAQSSMQQSSSVSPVTVTQSHVPNNIRNENSNPAHADHHIHQSSSPSTSNATTEEEILNNDQDVGFSEQSEVPQSSSLPLAAAPEGSKGIENCQDEEDDAPIPVAQIAARYESMEKSMGIENCQDEGDVPIPAAQIAARYESIEKSTKKNKKPELNEDDDDSPPLPPWQISCEDEDLATKKSYETTSPAPPISDCQPSASDAVVPPSTFDEDIQQSIPNSAQPQVEIIIHRPPPPSMLPHQSDDEEEVPSADLPSLPILEATLVEQPPVYDAIAIRFDANQGDTAAQDENGDKTNVDQHASSWWKRNKKYMLVALASLAFGAMAATIAALVGSQEDDNNIEPVETLQPTVPVNDTSYTMNSETNPSTTNTTTSTIKPSTAVSRLQHMLSDLKA